MNTRRIYMKNYSINEIQTWSLRLETLVDSRDEDLIKQFAKELEEIGGRELRIEIAKHLQSCNELKASYLGGYGFLAVF